MKSLALILALVWLTGCATGERSSRTSTPISPGLTPSVLPARSVPLAPTIMILPPIEPFATHAPTPVIPTRPGRVVVTLPIVTLAPHETSAPVTHPSSTATADLPECPPLPEPTEIKTQAAVQRFEHGLMFWLQERAEIWILIAAPSGDHFYWRILPNLWSAGQPENDPQVQPPADRFQPVRGFGYAWRWGGGSYGPQRADLGWALDQEIGFDTMLIYYPQGFYSPDCTWMPKSGLYELRDEHGAVYQFSGAGGEAKLVKSAP